MKADQDQVQTNHKKPVLGTALQFVILMGLVSLLADVTYEGARSAIGPFLALLGASGAVVGFYSGLGELLGYSLRFLTGFLSDRTGRYWLITITGYCVNLLAVPLLALAGRWEIAVALVIAERVGKAIRTPARDAMLSHATSQLGQGWGFGLHEALDQIGAVLGPLVLATVLFMKSGATARLADYQIGFAFLLIPALLAIGVLLLARHLFPKPRDLEVKIPQLKPEGFNRNYWLYLAATALVAAGYADFPLVAYHFGKVALMPAGWIPLCYAIAMGVDALAALLFGRWFDRRGWR